MSTRENIRLIATSSFDPCIRAWIIFQVEQLSDHTGEESVILTASVSDGSLSHLGSESGKVFLEDHDDIKSQFLGFCLKRKLKPKVVGIIGSRLCLIYPFPA